MLGDSASQAAAAASASIAAANAATPKAPLTAAQAYWAAQPPAVQALQKTSGDEAVALGTKLAQQGYAIDVPIVVWHWNPLQTMLLRQADGYTWIPSALQPPVVNPPGFNTPGYAKYDAQNPPKGSVLVTTDFAKGTSDEAFLKSYNSAVTADT
jgi:hypothetical protein